MVDATVEVNQEVNQNDLHASSTKLDALSTKLDASSTKKVPAKR
jgi:hypothetical protein